MLKAKKVEVIEKLASSLDNATAVVICDYKGLTVSNLEELRRSAKVKGTSVQVVKNTLAKIAPCLTWVRLRVSSSNIFKNKLS